MNVQNKHGCKCQEKHLFSFSSHQFQTQDILNESVEIKFMTNLYCIHEKGEYIETGKAL